MNKDLILREQLAIQRTTLANQSTFLAFLRTSMYFLLAGFTLQNLIKVSFNLIFENLMFLISALLFIYGVVNYFVFRYRIQRSKKNIGEYRDNFLES